MFYYFHISAGINRINLLQLFNDFNSVSPEGFIEETDKTYQLTLDVPGVKKEDINIEVNNGILTVSGERKGARACTFEKRFRLGDNVVADEIKANLTDGVLSLELAKAEKARARKIMIAG